MIEELKPAKIAEIGCGAGELLVTLGRRGFGGVGYDLSPMVRDHARTRLNEARVSSFQIVDEWPERGGFDVVMLLEVLGYLDDPCVLLERCRALLAPHGRLIVSYARSNSGYDPKVVAGMKFFSREDVAAHLSKSGFTHVRQINYGFPLANALVGVNNRVYRMRLALRQQALKVEETAVAHTWPWLKPAAIVSNRWTLRPFFAVQRLSADTDLGNGYVASAEVSR